MNISKTTKYLLLLVVFSSWNENIGLLGREMTLAKVFGAMAVVSWIANAILQRKKELKIRKSYVEVAVLMSLFFIWSMSSVFWAEISQYYIKRLLTITNNFILFAMLVDTFRTRHELITLAKTICLAGVFSSIISISIFYSLPLLSHVQDRVEGTFDDSNIEGFHLVLSFCICAGLYLWERKDNMRHLYLGAGLIHVIVLLHTLSRSSLFVLLIAILLLLYRMRKNISKSVIAWGVFTTLMFSLVFSFQIYRLIERFDGLVRYLLLEGSLNIEGTWSLMLRSRLANAGISVIMDHPIFGVGLGNFKNATLKYFPFEQVPHNTYLLVAAELGLVGLALYLLILSSTLKKLLIAESDELTGLNYGFMMAFICLLTYSLLLDVYFMQSVWIIIFTCILAGGLGDG